MATVSAMSLSAVPVPCALTYPIALGDTPASSSARFIARSNPWPLGLGEVMWCASDVLPHPRSIPWIVAERARAAASDSITMQPAPSPNVAPTWRLNGEQGCSDIAPSE